MNFFRRSVTAFAIVVGLMFTVQTVAVPFANAEITKASAVSKASAVNSTGLVAQASPVIAIILAFLAPGLGHIYVGSTGTGILIAILCVVNWCLIGVIIGTITLGLGYCRALVLHLGLFIWDALGSYNIAKGKGGKGTLKDVEDRVKEGLDDDARMVNPLVRPASAFAY